MQPKGYEASDCEGIGAQQQGEDVSGQLTGEGKPITTCLPITMGGVLH